MPVTRSFDERVIVCDGRRRVNGTIRYRRAWSLMRPAACSGDQRCLPHQGDMDDFYLNLAVYRFEEFLRTKTNPRSAATFTYGRPMKGHSWHAWTWGRHGP